ncbi:hypothetical protein [uncultured Sphingopyxis sp.]|uniref:hypothetical protein n=1 Tax=uncultured Sphingopyxis sp. TaxID=310581 RepID=UPI0025E9F756|nr:hypothetical protein [uncultured Sphingopyxis sp.]
MLAVTQGLGIAKTLRGIEKDYDAAAYKAQIADLINALTDAKLALADAKERAADRDKEIEGLRSAFEAKGNLVKGDGDYNYFAGDDGKPIGFPLCPSCDADGRIVQMKQDGPTQTARCPTCDKSYKPVTCYLIDGDTLRAQELRRQAEGLARTNAILRGGARGRNDWMV